LELFIIADLLQSLLSPLRILSSDLCNDGDIEGIGLLINELSMPVKIFEDGVKSSLKSTPRSLE
jgi:hypothetical protein